MTAVLVAQGVRKSYGRHQVLAGADLTVESGQLVAVVGENGAGKSTLLKTLAGTLKCDAGTVELCGTLGYCPQEAVLSDNLTVDQHLRYFAAAYHCPVFSVASSCWSSLGLRSSGEPRQVRYRAVLGRN